MDRIEAYRLVTRYLGNTPTLAHCLSTESCMRTLARRFDADEELWGITGLVHDVDLVECDGDLERHTLVGAQILKEHNVSEEIITAVLGHNNKAKRETLMAKALWVVDPTTGFITASALIRPSKSTSDLTVKSIKKKMKDKRFAAAVNRDQIRACETEIDIPLDEFLLLCVGAMDSVRDEIGLGGVS
jgi:putative nucleotidyltransferase with HDIG domain